MSERGDLGKIGRRNMRLPERWKCKIGEYTLSDDDIADWRGGHLGGPPIKAIKATDESDPPVVVWIYRSTEPPLKRFYVLPDAGEKLPFELDQEGNLSPASHDGKRGRNLTIPAAVLCKAIQKLKLKTEKG